MKILLFILFPFICFGQVDSTTIATDQVIKAAEKIVNQADTIKELRGIQKELHIQINIQSVMIEERDNEIKLLERRNAIADGIIERYESHLRKDSKRWYNHPVVYFTGGIVTTYISSLIIRNIR